MSEQPAGMRLVREDEHGKLYVADHSSKMPKRIPKPFRKVMRELDVLVEKLRKP